MQTTPKSATLLGLATLAALGLTSARTAQAQTFNGYDQNNNILYTADLNKSNVSLDPAYTYNYIVTLDKVYSPSVNVNAFTFNFGAGVPVDYVSSSGYSEASVVPGAFVFGAPAGLTAVGQQATFSFFSPLPPVGSVSTASTSPGLAGGGTTAIGPATCNCPVVPEPASLALLGLGAFPLALAVRRRKA